MHYYQFNIGDYASHTRHLTLLEDLAYRRLLDLYYLHEQPLNPSSTIVARLINMRDNEREIELVLHEFFELVEGVGWVNSRADSEISAYKNRRESASRAGKASAERRLNARSTTVQLNKNHKPITKNQEPKLLRRALPLDFAPTDGHKKLAEQLRVSLTDELAKFSDYHVAKGTVMKDWNAALNTWLRNAVEFNRSKAVPKRNAYVHDLSEMDYTKGVDEDGNF